MNNKELVFATIKKSSKHLTAYDILDKIQKTRKIQPMTIYRALDSLMKEDRIHKSNQNKTFILCKHSHKENHNTAIAVCKKCGAPVKWDGISKTITCEFCGITYY